LSRKKVVFADLSIAIKEYNRNNNIYSFLKGQEQGLCFGIALNV
jgi:hypothetical protein